MAILGKVLEAAELDDHPGSQRPAVVAEGWNWGRPPIARLPSPLCE